MNTDTAADLHTEVRRLRVRISGLSNAQLAAPAEVPAGSQPEPSIPTRRDAIRAALAALSELRAEGRPVPDLGDRLLSDQVVVLLQDCLPEYGATEAQCRRALDIARQLRHALA